ncbi:MAG: recombinase family protein [Acidobacteriota bacterium]|nr:recombinase family protein [Acidobacteriota bacterium]
MKAAIYSRVSLPTQHISNQLHQLRELAAKRGFEVVGEYQDLGNSGTKARRPGLDALMTDARRRKFSVVLVTGFDRIARSTRHFLQVLDEIDSLNVQFISVKESIDTTGPTGRLFLTLVGCIGELEGALIRERIRQGMVRRRLEGFRLGRAPLNIDHQALAHDRRSGLSLTTVAKKYGVSRASVVRFTRAAMKGEPPHVGEFHPAAVLAPVECLA